MKHLITLSATILLAIILLAGCGDDKNPLSAFQPEIVNNPDAFAFQITDASNVTATVSYSWSNTGTQASIDHSTVTGAGTAVLAIYDADSTLVYSSALIPSGGESTSLGVAGSWTVIVSFVNYSGTSNFRIEKQ